MRVIPSFVSRLPGSVQHTLGILPGEKVIAWGSGPGPDATHPAFAAATGRALYAQTLGERIPWDRISKATWNDPVLELVTLDEHDQPTRVVRLEFGDARDLPPAIHDRVTDSVVVSERVDLGAGAAALMVARRGSDDGVIRWSVVFDSGLNPADPVLRERADQALAQLRDALGI